MIEPRSQLDMLDAIARTWRDRETQTAVIPRHVALQAFDIPPVPGATEGLTVRVAVEP